MELFHGSWIEIGRIRVSVDGTAKPRRSLDVVSSDGTRLNFECCFELKKSDQHPQIKGISQGRLVGKRLKGWLSLVGRGER